MLNIGACLDVVKDVLKDTFTKTLTKEDIDKKMAEYRHTNLMEQVEKSHKTWAAMSRKHDQNAPSVEK